MTLVPVCPQLQSHPRLLFCWEPQWPPLTCCSYHVPWFRLWTFDPQAQRKDSCQDSVPEARGESWEISSCSGNWKERPEEDEAWELL